jgi:predicted NAD/FAD-dependent oxidoreductase
MRSLVTDLAEGLDVVLEHTVEAVRVAGHGRPRVDGGQVDAVVLAMPDPQAQRLLDPRAPGVPALDVDMWQPVLAVALGFGQRSWPADLHGAFVHDSAVLDWLADDGDRRGDGAPVLVAHTTADFASQHLADPGRAVPAVVAAVQRMLGLAAEPGWTHVHRWTYARPANPRAQAFTLSGALGVCGDGWSAPSRVESAWRSGTALGRRLAAQLAR